MSRTELSAHDETTEVSMDPGQVETLIVRSLRRQGLDPEDTAAAFRRVLGAAHGADAQRAVLSLASALAPVAEPETAAPRDQRNNSHTEAERLLLTALSARQGGNDRLFDAMIAALQPSGRREALASALAALAGVLTAAGCRLPAPPRQDPPARTAQCNHVAASMVVDGVEDLDALRYAERLLIGSVRYVVLRLKRGAIEVRDLETELRKQGIDNAVPAMVALTRIVGTAAKRKIDIRCCGCPKLSPDEARLLHIVAVLQRGDQKPASALLLDWLPPAARSMAMQPAYGIAIAFTRANLNIPLRAWSFPELNGLPQMWPAGVPASVRLH